MSASSAMARSAAFSPKTCARTDVPGQRLRHQARRRSGRGRCGIMPAAFGVTLASSHADLAAQADLIVSAVTASQAVPVAAACAPAVKQGAWFLDFNSASPGAKRRAAVLIDGAGGRYVEGAVMTSVPPYRIKVPLLLGGGGARELAPLAGRTRLQRQGRQRRARRRLGGQDVPQRHDQGPGSHGDRDVSPRRGPTASRTRCWLRWRRPFPASTGRSRAPIFSSASSNMAGAAAKKCARWRRPCARSV